MAIVPNKDGMGISANGHPTGPIDVSYVVPTTFASGVPSTAGYAGEIRVDTVTGDIYRNIGGTRWMDIV